MLTPPPTAAPIDRHVESEVLSKLSAVIAALSALKEPCRVLLTTDSQYVVNGMEKGWAKKWQANGWRKSDKSPALNTDLWERLLRLLDIHQVKVVWVKGHADNVENSRCDALAVAAAARRNALPPDTGFR